MSMIDHCKTTCPVCGGEVNYESVMSLFLQFKPTRMSDRTMTVLPSKFSDRRVCLKCGYVYVESIACMPQICEYVKTKEYQTCRNHLRLLRMADKYRTCEEYYKLGMVFEKSGDPLNAARSYLEAANGAEKNAVDARDVCYRALLNCYKGQKLSLEDRMVRLDILRRSRQWREALKAALHLRILLGKYRRMAFAQIGWIREKNSDIQKWKD